MRRRVTPQQWEHWRLYDRFIAATERTLERTNTVEAPWLIVEGSDEAYRSVTVATSVTDALRRAIADGRGRHEAETPARVPERRRSASRAASAEPSVAFTPGAATAATTILNHLDMSRSVAKQRFEPELERQRGRLHRLQRKAQQRGISTILVFENWDAAGKGGAIRRLTGALDARS